MADLFGDDFEATEQPPPLPQQEEDPAAAFLAQQENEIAGLENDVLAFESNEQPAVNGFDVTGDAPPPAGDDFFNVQDMGAAEPPPMTNGDEFVGGEMEEHMDPSQAYAAIAAADARLEQLRSEPEKIRIWREENTKLLAEKDREAERKQQELLAQAQKELEDWDRNRQEQVEKTKESNRTAEKQFVQERDQSTPGTEWERVSKLCDFNPKVSKGNKDVSRMRSSLLHLKQNPRPVNVTMEAASN
ncbi:clathrin light chain-like isoform X1 [Clavelina lepadiformis]|uniref:clathrin light chain-like isoform X1 n=1 Tax=Clavelina lepadiformis TaxID=159417 RepID=UPI0040431814